MPHWVLMTSTQDDPFTVAIITIHLKDETET